MGPIEMGPRSPHGKPASAERADSRTFGDVADRDVAHVLHAVLELHESANRLCRTLGLRASATLLNVPRVLFEEVFDSDERYGDGLYLLADPDHAVWAKYSVPSVSLYTREPPGFTDRSAAAAAEPSRFVRNVPVVAARPWWQNSDESAGELHVALYDLPRRVFDVLEDFEYGDHEGYLVVLDLERPTWWKRLSPLVSAFTYEPPRPRPAGFGGFRVSGRASEA